MAKRSWSCCATCTATARPSAWSRTTSATPISPSAPSTSSTAASWKKPRKPASEPTSSGEIEVSCCVPATAARTSVFASTPRGIGASMFSIFQDVQFGLRMLAKHRLATLVSIVALTLGIGANTAMFSLAEAFLLHPVPLENADRIVALVDSRPGQDIDMNAIAPATYFEWKQQAHSFDDVAAYAWQEVNLTGDGAPQKVQTFRVSANFLPMLGVRAQFGRSFLSEEEEPGKDHEIILGHALWEQRYASDPHIIGRTIKVDGK